ncbi:hypothetical protein EOA25_01330 [Mesorhizobium sp. M2A.F.Ca.ET.040.01.1.1]|nr:hypothetical protein EOA25_01330 [Mesorhizobium sp. M2A.F.Ca.ET.040.01.1.1]
MRGIIIEDDMLPYTSSLALGSRSPDRGGTAACLRKTHPVTIALSFDVAVLIGGQIGVRGARQRIVVTPEEASVIAGAPAKGAFCRMPDNVGYRKYQGWIKPCESGLSYLARGMLRYPQTPNG